MVVEGWEAYDGEKARTGLDNRCILPKTREKDLTMENAAYPFSSGGARNDPHNRMKNVGCDSGKQDKVLNAPSQDI